MADIEHRPFTVSDLIRFFLLGVLFALAIVVGVAHAETQAEKVFGKWERVTVAEIFKPVPEVENEKTARAGAVTNEYRRPVVAVVQVHSFQGSKPADYVKPTK